MGEGTFCSNCGSAVGAGDKFCTSCGHALGKAAAAVAEPPATAYTTGRTQPKPQGLREVVLSPDRTQFWDGEAWSAVVMLSPDGRYAWDGQEWRPVVRSSSDGTGGHPVPATLGAWGTCLGASFGLILIGNVLGEGLKLVVEAFATLPVLLIHPVDDMFKRREFSMPSPAHVVQGIARVGSTPWWQTAAIFGVAIGIFDNTIGLVLGVASGAVAVIAVLLAPLVAGAILGFRSRGKARLASLAMGYPASMVNIFFVVAVLHMNTGDPTVTAIFGVVLGGSFIALLGVGGHELGRLVARRSEVATPAAS
jgi:zinc-ribbon domain